MSETIASRLQSLGISLPQAAAPAANYVACMQAGDLLFVSGQLPIGPEGLTHTGKLGAGVTVEQGQQAARQCAINILSQASAALDGDLEKIRQFIRITGFVASNPDFVEQHLVINGASDFLVDVLGDRGRHSRAAVGMACLPLDAAVEVDAVIRIG